MMGKTRKKKKSNATNGNHRVFDKATGLTVHLHAEEDSFMPALTSIENSSIPSQDEPGNGTIKRSTSDAIIEEDIAVNDKMVEQKIDTEKKNSLGTSVCLYFQVHQPLRLRPYNFDQIGVDHYYENYDLNIGILKKVADKCYLPVNSRLIGLLKRHQGRVKLAFSISGIALEQFELYQPDIIKSFQELVATGSVELLAETYYHSLSFIYSTDEFKRQVDMHREKIRELFNVEPVIFRNTELIYNNDVAKLVASLGFKGMLCEGTDKYLNERNPNQVFRSPGTDNFGLLLKNYRLSDDIAFRFSNRDWDDWPLTAAKFSKWLHDHAGNAETINLFMDYETFGEHQWEETGIFDFLDELPELILEHPDFYFRSPSEVLSLHPARDIYDVTDFTSWADEQRDLSAWNENEMQREALDKIYALEKAVKETEDIDLIKVWGKLQTSDHFYYMSTKFWADGDVHKYFSPYESPYDACIYYMNVISDLQMTVANLRASESEK